MAHWLIDTAGLGSLIAIGVALIVLAAYARMLFWIQGAPSDRTAGVGQAAAAEDEQK